MLKIEKKHGKRTCRKHESPWKHQMGINEGEESQLNGIEFNFKLSLKKTSPHYDKAHP